jgi:hypothetical protein
MAGSPTPIVDELPGLYQELERLHYKWEQTEAARRQLATSGSSPFPYRLILTHIPSPLAGGCGWGSKGLH